MSKPIQRPSRKTAGRRPVRGPKVYYVASTHWDREWYEPFQHYRFRLVDVVDRVLELLDQDPAYIQYQLDGQTVVVDDYLKIRPERREDVARLVAEGRLEIGPWFVMPDEYLPCGESLVRNLLLGDRSARPFGGKMSIGFVCDIFGHISQLPQILRGFELDTAVVWRGTNWPMHPGLFTWAAPDGSSVLTYAFEKRGYGQYQFELRTPATGPDGRLELDTALEGLRRCIEIEAERVPGDTYFVFDGMDHIPPDPDAPALLEKARAAGIDIEFGSLDTFFEAVRQQKLKLKTFRGELREPGLDDSNVIQGVLASRIHLKQYNARCESLLLQWAEPFGVFAELLGHAYPRTYLDLAWRYLLLNHPHDSICGCSIDQVHQDMLYRFDQCRLIAERAGQQHLRAVADHTPRPDLTGPEDYAVTVFNPTDSDIDEVVELPLLFDRETEARFQEWFGYEPIVGFRLFDADGEALTAQRLDVVKNHPYKTFDRTFGYEGVKYERVRTAVRLRVPQHGWTTVVCRPTKERTRSAGTQLVDDHTMANEHLQVAINANGTIDLTDRATGRTYENLLTFEERADIGDGWYHGTAINDEIYSSFANTADIALVHDGFALTTFRIRAVMNVPERFLRDKQIMRRSPDVVPLVITSWVTLRAGADRLEVRTEVENTVRDHRLRVLFPTGVSADTYLADSAFDVLERNVALRADAHKLHEPELETKPQYTFTAIGDGEHGLAVISRGQPESAVRDLPTRPIALTLYRGFARTVAAEGEEGGQELGRTAHDYWIVPQRGPLDGAALARLGQRISGGLECVYTRQNRLPRMHTTPVLPATGSWFRLGRGPMQVTACKQAEDGQGLVLRLFNPTAKKVTQRIEFCAAIAKAQRVNMLEEKQEELTRQGKTLSVAARGKEIVTLRVALKPLAPQAKQGSRGRGGKR